MASTSRATTILLALLFLFTFSHARHVTDPFPKPQPEPEIRTSKSKSKPRQPDTVSFTLDSADPVPLTLLTLRPIARPLPPRRQLPLPLLSSLRFGHRRCRHGHRREISYGNDAIVRSSGVVTVDRLIPARWVRIRHGQPRISEIPRFDRHVDHDHDNHHHHGQEEKQQQHDEGWFVKKIRNFFNLFGA